jgi:hypothetical protein
VGWDNRAPASRIPAPAFHLSARDIFAAVFVTLFANGIQAQVSAAIHDGWTVVGSGLGVNWVVWGAAGAVIRLLVLDTDRRPATRTDCVMAGSAVLAAAWPLSEAAWAGTTLLGAFLLLTRLPNSAARAAGIVMLAMSVPMLWARVFAQYLATPLTRLDTSVVAWVAGTRSTGNVLYFVGSTDNVLVSWSCSSFGNVSVALLLFVALVRSVRLQPRATELATLVATFATVFALNTFRLALIAQSRTELVQLHGPLGTALLGAFLTVAGVSWALFELRRDLA